MFGSRHGDDPPLLLGSRWRHVSRVWNARGYRFVDAVVGALGRRICRRTVDTRAPSKAGLLPRGISGILLAQMETPLFDTCSESGPAIRQVRHALLVEVAKVSDSSQLGNMQVAHLRSCTQEK